MILVFHRHPVSANAHRVRPMLSLLGRTFEERTVDLAGGGQHASEHLALNLLAIVPVLQDGDLVLRESHATLTYLSRRYAPNEKAWWPQDAARQAEVVRRLFFGVGDLHHGVGLARNGSAFGAPSVGNYAFARAETAFRGSNAHLHGRDRLERDRPTLPDVAVHPFVAVMGRTGLRPERFRGVRTWAARSERRPAFVPVPGEGPLVGAPAQ